MDINIDTNKLITIAIIVGALILVGLIVIRAVTPRIVAAWAKRSMSEGEREKFDAKHELLTHKEIIEALAPTADFQTSWDKKSLLNPEKDRRRSHQSPFISPWPKAVKANNKRHRKELKRGKDITLTRAQIAEAASKVRVEELPDHLQPGNPGPEHYSITFKLKGLTEAKIRGLLPAIQAQLELHSLEPLPGTNYGELAFKAHETEPKDRLVRFKPGSDFFNENPAKKVTETPLAVNDQGEPWSLPVHHTLILGMTGSGKGSPIHGLIRQLAPGVREGVVKLYGADPKVELMAYRESTLFEGLGFIDDNPDNPLEEIGSVINSVYKILAKRVKDTQIDREKRDLGRSLDPTKENPMIVLVIDELMDLLITAQSMKTAGKKIINEITSIFARGRSLGVYIVGATQEADRELLGRIRSNIANFIVLKQPSQYFNNQFLGDGAWEAGFDSTKIKAANKANGYETAGIGFVKGETGDPVRVRFAYSSDGDIIDLIDQFPRETLKPSSPITEEPLSEEDLENSWTFEEIEDEKPEDELEERLPDILL